MFIYLLVFIFTSFLGFLQFGSKKKVSPYLFGVYVLAIGAFVGLGDMVGGYDRYIYAEVYTSLSEKVSHGDGVFNETFIRFFAKEPLYGLINVLIGLFSPNRYVFFISYSVIMYAVFGISLYRYTKNPFFAMLIFLGLMFFFTFTYLRQVLAAGIVWLALPSYVNRKFWKYIVIIALATLTHNSAAIMFLLYFIPLKKWAFSRIMIVMSLLFALGLFGVGEMFNVAGSLTGMENISRHANSAEVGFRYEYVFEAFLFLILLRLNYKYVSNDKKTLSYANLFLMFCGILLFFCKSGDGGRISWYGMMGLVILLTNMSLKNIGLRSFLALMLFLLYFRTLDAWSFNLCPYKTFFTPGHTGEQWIYDQYEYDQNYDYDKFYNL